MTFICLFPCKFINCAFVVRGCIRCSKNFEQMFGNLDLQLGELGIENIAI